MVIEAKQNRYSRHGPIALFGRALGSRHNVEMFLWYFEQEDASARVRILLRVTAD